MNIIDLLALALATGGLVDCWLNGSIFQKLRKATENWTLFQCDYCMNWQTPLWLILFFYLPSLWLPYPWDVVDKLPVYWLAAAYTAWLVNEVRAGQDCDYARTSRAEADMKKYGSSEPDATKTEDKPGTPATFLGDVIFIFCSPECQKAYNQRFTSTYGSGVVLHTLPGRCSECNAALDPNYG